MRAALKHIVAHTYKPLLVKYLSKSRKYRYEDLKLEIPPEVFHPRFFFQHAVIVEYVDGFSLEGKTFLELGSGSGLIAIHAAKKTAIVTASDINPVAIDYLLKNCVRNSTGVRTFQSDLFDDIPPTKFDIIAINPPYYKNNHNRYWTMPGIAVTTVNIFLSCSGNCLFMYMKLHRSSWCFAMVAI
jgi:release factor glutamine methyltransferase